MATISHSDDYFAESHPTGWKSCNESINTRVYGQDYLNDIR